MILILILVNQIINTVKVIREVKEGIPDEIHECTCKDLETINENILNLQLYTESIDDNIKELIECMYKDAEFLNDVSEQYEILVDTSKTESKE